jgi:hypothetical protein
MEEAAPLVYRNITGLLGLAVEDPAWEALMQPGASAGFSFLTNNVVMAREPEEQCFVDDKGYRLRVNRGSVISYELQHSDVVCFRSAPTDTDGYHSLIRTREDMYDMPPLATVTLESVQQPGEWEVCGHKVKRRLLTVSVSYK